MNENQPADQRLHHRHSMRLQGYDYSQAGMYFVTIVTHDRAILFGEIVDGEIQLSRYGEIVKEEWERAPMVRTGIELDAYVIMPNQIHGILCFHDVGTTRRVGATRRVPPTMTTLQAGSLGAVMAQFKSIVTKRIHSTTPIWQRNYYEHIIRDQADYERIAGYIPTNPSNWYDDENPEKHP